MLRCRGGASDPGVRLVVPDEVPACEGNSPGPIRAGAPSDGCPATGVEDRVVVLFEWIAAAREFAAGP